MKRLLALLLPCCLAVFLTSCLQQEDKVSVNPDGTAKFTIKVSFNNGKLAELSKLGGAQAGKSNTPTGQDLIVNVMSGCSGVDVWSEAKSVTDDGSNTHITLTGYARDITKLKIGNAFGALVDANKKDQPTPPPGLGGITTSRKEPGKWLLAMDSAMEKPSNARPMISSKAPKELRDEELIEKVKAEKIQMQISLGMMGAVLKDLSLTRTYEVAGSILDAGAFTKVDDKTATLKFDLYKGTQGLAELGMKDPKAMKAALKDGKKISDAYKYMDLSQPAIQNEVTKAMFGSEGKLLLTIKPGAALFDYPSEAKKAFESQSAELKSFIKQAEQRARQKP
jgi:hypothetical protein